MYYTPEVYGLIETSDKQTNLNERRIKLPSGSGTQIHKTKIKIRRGRRRRSKNLLHGMRRKRDGGRFFVQRNYF